MKILMGTDAPQQFSVPGFSLHRELLRMREAGMSTYEILKSGTVNVGQYFAKQDSFGTIESRQARRSRPAQRQPARGHRERVEDRRRDGARKVVLARGSRRAVGEDRRKVREEVAREPPLTLTLSPPR